MTTVQVDSTLSLLEGVVRLAQDAGAAVLRHYRGDVAFECKDDASPITAADREAHAIITEELGRWDPAVPVISEEAVVPPYEERRGWRRFWLVDPLDGTKEFIAANGEFTINIALVENAEPVLGVVCAPALGTIFLAAKGLGAWRREGSCTMRLGTAPRRSGITRIVESRSHASPRLEAFIATLGPVQRIPLGSSLKFCRVAESAADLYPRFGRTMEWDVAAGDCIYRNSGLDGRERYSPLKYNQPSLSSEEFVIGRPGC